MNILSANQTPPPEQRTIQEKRFNPTGTFVEFKKEEIEQSIPQRFEKIVQLYPDRTAIETTNRSVTYSDLNVAANRVARAILEQCGKGQEPAALVLENDAPVIASVLGILKAGKMYVPLDPAFPTARNSYVLADTQARVVVTNDQNLPQARELARGKCELINIDAIDLSPSDENLDLPISPDSLAYILYTSGSTGNPKGIVQNHRNVLHLIMRYTNQARLCAKDRVALLRSFSVHGGTLQTFGALLNGATVWPFDVRRQGARELAKWMLQEKITVCRFGPTLFRHFAAMLEKEDYFPDLRTVSFSGEPLYQSDIELCRRHFPPDCLLVNSFGATEVSSCCEYVVGAGSRIGANTFSCGTPTSDMEILLLDENRNSVDRGDVGEIAVKSRYLSVGYWRQPELTSAKFLPDSEDREKRIYLTGDLGRILEDGGLEYVGRKDFRVKIRDYTIEVAEVEAALMALEVVEQAVVVSSRNATEEARLVAYVVPAAKAAVPMANALRRALALRLPDYMIPSIFVSLAVLPLTPNGKLDRRALPEPDISRPYLDVPYAAPRTQVEFEVERIWAEVLSLRQVGIHDNFLDLGGHSLAATRIVSRMAGKFQVEISIESLFRSPTIAGMACVIADQVENENNLEKNHRAIVTSAISRQATRESAPLSSAQQRLWFLNQLEPESAAYNEPKAVRLIGSLNISALHEALNQLVIRHEVLRTTFAVVGGVPQQRIAEFTSIEFPLMDLTARPDQEREAEIEKLLAETIRRPFDLTNDLMLRALLIRLADQEHVLVLVAHHIAFDRWSSAILWCELAAVYEAVALGRALTLPDLPIQYADFATWQRQCLQGGVFDNQLSYWKKQLEGMSILRLPNDRSNVSSRSHDGDRRSLKLPEELAQRLKALSRQENVTLFVTLLAAFQTLLRFYTGQDDIVVGSPVAGRSRPEIESLIGFFVNTVLLRADLFGNPTFRELVAKVREVVFGVYANQDLPFEMLVEKVQPERSLGQTPLFRVVFALQNVPSEIVELARVKTSPLEVNNGSAKFDLGLFMIDENDGLIARIDYDASLFDSATIERMLTHFQTLLEGIVVNPDKRICDLQILTEAEKHRLLVEWNDTNFDYPKDKCIHELFEAQAEKSPDAIATIFQDKRLTYRELNQRANQLAHHLRRLGVGPEVRVGVCIERSTNLIVALLGILKAGGAYVPLDSEYPKGRLAFILRDTEASVLLTQQWLLNVLVEDREWKMEDRDLRSSILDPRLKVVCLDRDWPRIESESQKNPETEMTASNLAYVMYTSGSAGKPKGVEITHRGITRLLFGIDYARLDASQTFLHSAPISFDASTFEIWGALLHGAKCVLFPGKILTPAELGDILHKHSISILWLTASLFNVVIDESPEALSGVQQLLIGGEALSVPHVRRAVSSLSMTEVSNGYGPTEGTTFTCCYRIPRQLNETTCSIPIGRPIANTEVYLLDSNLSAVPVGVAGELHIGGDGLARGYLNQPELTAEKFIPNPFGNEAGSRLYKTGDLGRYLPDGNIEFLGRTDHQVKIRGFRIELEEIEAVLGQHPAVREAVVIAREDDSQDPSAGPPTSLRTGKRLVAYVANAAPPPHSDELRNFLKHKLPEYMVPSTFVFLDSLPLTSNGKVDRTALPAPDQSRPELQKSYQAPRTPLEEMIAQIWAEVLRLDRVGIHDNFFDLGGHSLLATQVVSRIGGAWQVDLPLRTIFETPTVCELAVSIEEARLREQGSPILPILPVSRYENLPLSFAQQRVWFLDQLEPRSTAYNVPGAVRMRGPLDVVALEQSLNEIVRRHESLRTSFSLLEGEPVQIVSPSLCIPLIVLDLSEQAETEQEEEARRLASEEVHRPFDLTCGPLLRATLISLGQDDYVLLLTLHHIVCDGWSMGVLYRELSILYEAFSQGKPSPLPDLPVQYVDYAVWQREWLRGEVSVKELSYWKTQLENVPTLQLPTDRPRPAAQSYRGGRQSIRLSEELAQGLKALSRKNDVTLFMTLLAAFQTLLHRYTGQDDIAVGSPIAGRNRHETEQLIGFFVNTLVLRTALSGDPSFRELLRRVREVALEAYAHQDLPFERLVEELQPERDLSCTPLFQVFFNMFTSDDARPDLPGVTVESLSFLEVESKFDLTLYVKEQSGRIHLSVVYNADLFDAARMDEMLAQLKRILEQIVESADKPVSSYSLVTEKCRRFLPDPTAIIPEPHFETVTAQFLSWANRSPEGTAVCQGTRAWTYEELSDSATRIAIALADRGIQRGETVAVTGPRSFGLIGSMLGVLLSGGVLLTIDQKLPANRRRLMIEEGRTRCLLYVGEWRQEDRWLGDMMRLAIINVAKDEGAIISNANASLMRAASLPEVSPDDPAYIFFTSGTTGVPKGVLGSHKGLIHFLAWQKRTFGIGPTDRCSQLLNLSFDPILREVFLPLIAGATLCLSDELTEPASERMLSWLDRQKITVLNVVPTLAQTWLGYHLDGVSLGSLRWAFFAGEALPEPLVRRWRNSFPKAGEIVNLYGPTETTLAKCFHVIPDEPVSGVQPIGIPLPQTQVLVWNQGSQPCGIGEPGEIVLRTPFRTFGYINAPEDQEMRFVKNPFRDDARDLVYHTGDRGRYGVDGSLEIVGRLDDQVKIHGVRVEPTEVTAILGQHPSVKACFVGGRRNHQRQNILAAYVVPAGADPLSADDLRSHLSLHLPAAFVPSAFVFLDTLPLSPNGKVDRNALPEPVRGNQEPKIPFVAPRTPVEEMLAEIWASVLKVERVGIRENFFELGGHSLIGIKLVSQLRRKLNFAIPLRAIFEKPTIESLALYLLQQQAGKMNPDETEEMLSELESSCDEIAESQVIEPDHNVLRTAPAGEVTTSQPAPSVFHCPPVKSEFFGKRECNLIIVINERFEMASFEKLAGMVRQLDPRINAVVVKDADFGDIALPNVPTLTFSPAVIRHHPRRPGRVFCGYPLSKSEEYAMLTKAGVAVPKWMLLTEHETADLSSFDDYVVRKPDYGGRSAEVRILRRDRVKWKPITTRSAGTSLSMIVQQFVYTGVRPVTYRVSTLFGRVLHCVKQQADPRRPVLATPADLKLAVTQKGFSISASGKGSNLELSFDEEVIRLGERAHTAFPDIPLLGFDIVREVPSGKLYVLEANAIGYVWQLHSRQRESYGFSFEEQFDGVRKAAYVLAEKTQQYAR